MLVKTSSKSVAVEKKLRGQARPAKTCKNFPNNFEPNSLTINLKPINEI